MHRLRGLIIGAASLAAVGVPLGSVMANTPASHTLADCPGSINVPIMNIGAPVDTCPQPAAPAYTGGAPSQQVLTDCSGIPGCLSNVLYGPGNVYVPRPNTTVQQSQ